MSDPVTNVEIEDVLSSIRRLVSNDERAAQPVEEDPPQEAERLVLTPSLRVDNSDNGVEDASELPQDAPEVSGAGDDEGFEVSEVADHEVTADWSEPEPETEPDIEPETPAAEPDFGLDDVIEDETAEGDGEAAPVTTGESDELRARVAEMEEVVAARNDQWEPDGESTDAYAGSPVDPLPWEDYLPQDTGEATANPGQIPDEDTASGDDDPFGSGDQSQTEQHEEDLEWGEVDAAPEMPDPDTEDPLAASDIDPPPVAESEDDLAAFPDDVLDEDALRDLVADIVREELQGALGERITRNVRKLVRREIHRALAIQELE